MDGETTENCPCCGVACIVRTVFTAPNGKDRRIERHPLIDSEHCRRLEEQNAALKGQNSTMLAALQSACERIVELELAIRTAIQELNQ